MLVLAACSKKDPPPPEPTEPWPAHAVTSSSAGPVAAHVRDYEIDERGIANFSLKGTEAVPSGQLRVARGRLQIDLADLARSRGKVAMDVASVSMDEWQDGGANAATNTARAWLAVGADRPEAERERLRWATFEITRISEVSADTPASGRVVKQPPSADASADAGDGGSAEPGTSRSVRLKALGTLTFNGYRVERGVSLEVMFHWRAGQSEQTPPTALSLRTRSPLFVELAAFDVAPRDQAGRRVPADDRLLGRQVGREARVELQLSAKLSGK